jgi:hypothetical protein
MSKYFIPILKKLGAACWSELDTTHSAFGVT